MSKFFRALEQAELDSRPLPATDRAAPAAPATPPSRRTPPPAPSWPASSRPAAPVAERAAAPGRGDTSTQVEVPTWDDASSRPAAPSRPDAPSRAERRARADARGRDALPRVDAHLVSLLAPSSIQAEQYRLLRHSVEEARRLAGVQVVAVSSAVAGDGKTTTAINLAGALAQARDARVLLVDADLPRAGTPGGVIPARVGLAYPTGPGLMEAIVDPSLDLADVVRPQPIFNFSVLPAGRRPEAPYELLGAARLGELFQEARARYDFVVVDTPPLVPLPDCRVLAKWIDTFVLVVGAGRTPRRMLEQALDGMEPDKVLGLVWNGDEAALAGYKPYDAAGRHGEV